MNRFDQVYQQYQDVPQVVSPLTPQKKPNRFDQLYQQQQEPPQVARPPEVPNQPNRFDQLSQGYSQDQVAQEQRPNRFAQLSQGYQPASPEGTAPLTAPAPAHYARPHERSVRNRQNAETTRSAVTESLTKTLHGHTPLMWLLEMLDRPRAGLAAATGAAMGKWGSERIGEALSGEDHVSWEATLPEKVELPGSAATWGVLGAPTAELMGRKQMDSSSKVPTDMKFLTGLAMDVVLDPINFITMGTLTKSGASGKMLKNLFDVHADDIARQTGIDDLAEVTKRIAAGDEAVLEVLRKKGVPEKSLTLAQKASEHLADTLVEQAEKGQWAAARFGPWTTPKAVNVPVAKALGKIREGVPKTQFGAAFVNRSGKELFDKGKTELFVKARAAETQLLENIAWLQEKFEGLTEGERLTEKLIALGDITKKRTLGEALEAYYPGQSMLQRLPRQVREMELWDMANLADDAPSKKQLINIWNKIDPQDADAGESFMHVFERRLRPQKGMPGTPGFDEFASNVKVLRDKYERELDLAGIPVNHISQVDYLPHVNSEKSQKMSKKIEELLKENTPKPVAPSIASTPPMAVSDIPKEAVIVPEAVDKEGFLPKMLHKVFESDAPTQMTPHQLGRQMKWITDPTTGEEFIGHTGIFALANGVPEEAVKSRQATVKEINRFFTKKGLSDPVFETNPIQSLLISQLNNERAIWGTKVLDWAIDETMEDALALSGRVRTLADYDAIPKNMRVFIPGAKRDIRRYGKVFSVDHNKGTANIRFQAEGRAHYQEIPLHQLIGRKDMEAPLRKMSDAELSRKGFVRLKLDMPSSYAEEISAAQRMRTHIPEEALTRLEKMDFPRAKAPAIHLQNLSMKKQEELYTLAVQKMEEFKGKEFSFRGGAKVHFSPGGKDHTWEDYVRHFVSGSGEQRTIQPGRVENLYYIDKVLEDPDAILRQNNGKIKLISSFEDMGKNRIVILEAEANGRLRGVTSFPNNRKNPYSTLMGKNEEILDVSPRINALREVPPASTQTLDSQHGTALHQAGIYGKEEASLPPSPVGPVIPPWEANVNHSTLSPAQEAFEMLKGLPVPAEKARVIQGMWETYAAPGRTVKEMEKIWKGYTSLWKRYTLFPFMEYHVRNVVGDLWNGWLQGWNGRSMLSDLMNAKNIQTKKPFSMTTGVYGKLSGEDIFRAAKNHGVIDSGQYSEVVTKTALSSRDPVKGGVWDRTKNFLGNVRNHPGEMAKRHLVDLEIPMAIGGFLEDNRRLGMFLNRLKKGDSFSQAAKAVTKALFDYNDITHTEKAIRTWAIPFYTWFKKNIPYQLEMFARKPGKIAVLPKIKGHIEGHYDSQTPEDLIPKYMKGGFPINMGRNTQGKERFALLQNWIPSVDLFSLFSDPSGAGQFLMGNMHPLAKVPLEQSWNKDFFFGGPIDTLRNPEDPFRMLRGNERTNYLGQNMATTTKKWMELLPITRLLSTFDRLNPVGIFDARGDYKPMNVAPGATKTRPWHTEMSTGEKLTKAISGLKIYPVDVERQIFYDSLGMRRSGTAPGLTEGNIKKFMKKAWMEGDQKTFDMYQRLLDMIYANMTRKQQDFQQYQQRREWQK